jgi:hypothetical protein
MATVPKVADPKPAPRSSGRQAVSYRHVDGSVMDAVVEGGTGTSLNLWVPHLPKANQHKTGVAKRTARAQTNVWW